MYNTGDLAKWLPNGEISYIGRTDFQVKIHGLRIELQEIESAISSFEGIQKVAVAVKTVNYRDFICAYFVANGRISYSTLKNYLSKRLPNYMVPAFLLQMEDFLYTPNGKINKKDLPVPNFLSINERIKSPQTPTEIKLEKIWRKLLSIDTISITDNFFEIGGDSLLALNMQIALLKIGININYSDIFNAPTIEGLSKIIDKTNTNTINLYYSKTDFLEIDKLLQNNNSFNLANVKFNPLGNVLLTGSTGFLGIHILAELVKIEHITIYCIIRPDPSTSPSDKLKHKLNYYFGNVYDNLIGNKIKIISSDLTKKRLNLTDEEYNFLGSSISTVINSAAIVKHYGNYSDWYTKSYYIL